MRGGAWYSAPRRWKAPCRPCASGSLASKRRSRCLLPKRAASHTAYEDKRMYMDGTNTAGRREKLLALAGLALVLFLVALDGTVVGTAMPRIIAELNGFTLY